jgi:Flp pilus assembly pilin Flp
MQHLMRSTALTDRPDGVGSLARARASHPAGTARLAPPPPPVVAASVVAEARDIGDTSRGVAVPAGRLAEEDGSLVTEYGLLAVVAATIAGVVMTWASGGALVTLFNALLRQARSLVGA